MELHRISTTACDDPARLADVVFVHGLMGDAHRTWRHGEDLATSWPHWVAEAYPKVGVWSLGYPASLSKWPRALQWLRRFKLWKGAANPTAGQAMALERRAVTVLDRLLQKKLGSRPLIFVCHSLGGLLVKQVLHASAMSRDEHGSSIVAATTDVMFLATPHRGAMLADLAKAMTILLRTTVVADDLMAHGAHLENLGEDYKTHAERHRIQTHVYYETIGVGGSDALVVNSTSADPGIGRRPVPLDRDHGSICKPLTQDDPVCERLKEILETFVGGERGPEGGIAVAHRDMGEPGNRPVPADNSAPFTSNPGAFVGRTRELEALNAAMLPGAQGAQAAATIICCAIDGMPGVGKTRLAEEFITRHWLVAYPPPPDTPPGACVLRLVLAAGEAPVQVRSADDLVRDLADRLELRGDLDALRRALPAALRAGPGGHPRLLLIENVDSDAQAEQVARLVQGLPGCPVLVTARVRKFGGQHWKRVDVAPMTPEDAIDLLRNEAAAGGKDACVPTEAQAQRLADALGYLPLALHIAASHLGMGKTPQEFLDELRETGLTLAPAQAGDHALQVDRARAILRSSFALSWRAWCAGAGRDPAWQQALVALAHGPAGGVGESLGAAIADLPPAQYGRCIVAAGRLSLLEWEWAGDGEARERRVRLHALIAEFLRAMPPPDAQTVLARIGGWFAPRVSDDDPETMGAARGQVQREPEGLLHWLGGTQLDEADLSIVKATHYAGANGPYGAWLACLQSARPQAGDTQRGFDLAWAVALLAQRSGDVSLAMRTAEDTAALAKQLGKDDEYSVAQGQIADVLQSCGELEEALRIRREEQMPVYERLGDVRERAITQGKIADILQARGELEEALRIRREEALPVYERLGDVRSRAITQGRIADILQARGELEEALRIRREEELPVYERLGDVRSRAITQGKIADILQARGELEEALRIRREEELPVYERLGDVHSRAITQGKIADILEARGELEEALRIRREEALPVYERLGDVRSRAITQGKIADILEARGELEEALRIRREEELPVYERLGDVRSRAIAQGQIADILQARGELEEALRIRHEEELPVYERLGDVRARAVTQGKIADILEAYGDRDEAIRIYREDVLPAYEHLGDIRLLLVDRANLAIKLVQRGREEDRPEILNLLRQALADAERLRLPEAQAIRDWIARIFGPDGEAAPP